MSRIWIMTVLVSAIAAACSAACAANIAENALRSLTTSSSTRLTPPAVAMICCCSSFIRVIWETSPSFMRWLRRSTIAASGRRSATNPISKNVCSSNVDGLNAHGWYQETRCFATSPTNVSAAARYRNSRENSDA
jgi:hypothetical protein